MSSDLCYQISIISFLSEWDEVDPYEIGDSGICLYAKEDLLERNETYR